MSVWTCGKCNKTNDAYRTLCQNCEDPGLEERRRLLEIEAERYKKLRGKEGWREAANNAAYLRLWLAEYKRDEIGRTLDRVQKKLGRVRKANRSQHHRVRELEGALQDTKDSLDRLSFQDRHRKERIKELEGALRKKKGHIAWQLAEVARKAREKERGGEGE